MAKGGRGRPKKIAIQLENTRAGESPSKFEIGEGSTVNSNGTVPAKPNPQEEVAAAQILSYKDVAATAAGNPTKTEANMRSRGMKLEFVAPTLKEGIPTACLDRSETEKEARKWCTAVILYVIGDSPTIAYLRNFLEKQCMIENKAEIYYHNDDYFVIRFGSMDDRDRVLYGGPHSLANRPVIVKEWGMDFCFEKEILREIPLWIQLPKLPLSCWSGDSLSRIGSVIGKPLCADECTTNQTRISYARMMVQVDVTQPLKYSIPVEGEEGQRIEQKVLYEWVPPFCKKCNKVGHIYREGRLEVKRPEVKQKQQWQKKQEEGKIYELAGRMENGKNEQKSNEGEEWTIPKNKSGVSPSMIQVGNLKIPTSNAYQVMEDGRADKGREDEGFSPSPSNEASNLECEGL